MIWMSREAQRLEEIEIEHRDVGHAADQRRIVRCAEAGMLRHDELVALGERVEEWQPLRTAVGAVEEQDGAPAPLRRARTATRA